MPRVEITENYSPLGYTRTYKTIHSDEELEELLAEEGLARQEAKRRGKLCVVKPCLTKKRALEMARNFYERFSSYECIHWDGKTISFYCGEAGSGAKELVSDISNMF